METKDQTAPERKPLLEITTLAPERPLVTIDDVDHELRLMQDFGAIEHQEFTRDSQRYDRLWSTEKLSKADRERMERLLDELFDVVLVDAAKVRAQLGDRLTGAIKREILLTFTNAPLLMAAMAQQTARETADGSTTES